MTIEHDMITDKVCFISLDDRSTHVIRREVAEFALAMETKLRKNDHKTGWHDQPIEAHIKLLKIELMEFDVAYEFLGEAEAAKECIDIANFALIIRDKLLARVKARNRIITSAEIMSEEP